MDKKKINVFLLIIVVLLFIILLLAISPDGYMLIRRKGQLKNNSLSTKLEAYNIDNDFLELGKKFDGEYNNILFCGVDHFNNTDVIMVISINKRLHNINILRIPRDTYIGDHYKTGKINAVYSNPKPMLTGADTLTYEINNIFRIKIDKYVFMTLDVFEKMIDDIGGVDIVLEKDLKIDESTTIKSGPVKLNGKLGADFVRHRKSYITGDIGRIKAQEQFVKSLGKKLIDQKYITNLPFLTKFYDLVETNIGRKEVNVYIKALKNIDVNNIQTYVLEGLPVVHNKYSVYVINVDNAVKILNRHFMPKDMVLKSDDLKLVKYLEPDEVKYHKEQNNLNSEVLKEASYGVRDDSYRDFIDINEQEDDLYNEFHDYENRYIDDIIYDTEQ